jgi:hypothetical protein
MNNKNINLNINVNLSAFQLFLLILANRFLKKTKYVTTPKYAVRPQKKEETPKSKKRKK